MKILVIYGGSFPFGMAMTNRLHLYCKGFIEQGHDIRIIVPTASDKFGTTILNKETSGTFSGISFEYLSNSTIRSKYIIIRKASDLLNYFKLFIYLIKQARKVNVFFIVDVRNLFRLIIIIIGKIFETKSIYELNEHPIFLTQKIINKRIGFWVERKILFPYFDGFIVISKSLSDLINTYISNSDKILVVPIIAEVKTIHLLNNSTTTIPYIFHSGSLSDSKDGIIGILEAFSIAIKKTKVKINLYFTGDISNSINKKDILYILENNELHDCVKFLGYLNPKELEIYQQNCMCTIINKNNNLQNRFCFPTKISDYISIGVPLLMTNVGPLSLYFKDNFNCYFVSPNDPELMAEKILSIIDNPIQRKKIGLNGYKLAQTTLSYSYNTKRIIAFFENIIQ